MWGDGGTSGLEMDALDEEDDCFEGDYPGFPD
jgi:hypothetical protein